ncbi:Ig-like domain-containing protein, partial [Thermodesulfobacteriota bacterium]
MQRRLYVLAVSVIILMAAVIGRAIPAHAFADNAERAQAAINYLELQQNADGSFGSVTALRDTSEIVKALNDASPTSASIQPGIDWMSLYSPGNDDYLARKVDVMNISATANQADIDNLLSSLQTDGWGASSRHKKDILSTIVIARVLNTLGALDAETKDAILNYVISQQAVDGSFSYYDSAISSVHLTADAVLFLKSMPTSVDVTVACESAGQFLLSSMVAGQIGEHPYESVISAKALLRLSSMTTIQKDELYSYIYSQQAVDGSIGNDIYATALGLSLFDNSASNLTVRDGSITLSNNNPQIGETVTATFIIDNLGDEAISNVNVKLYNCADNTLLGEYTITDSIDARGFFTVNINFAIATVGAYDLCVVIDDGNTISEQDESDNSGTINIIVLDGIAPLVSNISPDFEYISPNGDTIQDDVTISFDISEDVNISLVLVDKRGIQQTAIADSPYSTGTNTIIWDGRSESGALVDDGRYTVRLEAADTGGNIGVGITSVVIDTNRYLQGYSNLLDSIYPLDRGAIGGWGILGYSSDATKYVKWSTIDFGGGIEQHYAGIVNIIDGTEYIIHPPGYSGPPTQPGEVLYANYNMFHGISFSPDNEHIALTMHLDAASYNDTNGLYITNINGTDTKRVLEGYYNFTGNTSYTIWHPDGSRIFFSSEESGYTQLYSYDLNTSLITLVDDVELLSVSSSDFLLRLSKNGRYLIYNIVETTNPLLVSTKIFDLNTNTSRIIRNYPSPDITHVIDLYDWSDDFSKVSVSNGETRWIHDINSDSVVKVFDIETDDRDANWVSGDPFNYTPMNGGGYFRDNNSYIYVRNRYLSSPGLNIMLTGQNIYKYDINADIESLIWSGDLSSPFDANQLSAELPYPATSYPYPFNSLYITSTSGDSLFVSTGIRANTIKDKNKSIYKKDDDYYILDMSSFESKKVDLGTTFQGINDHLGTSYHLISSSFSIHYKNDQVHYIDTPWIKDGSGFFISESSPRRTWVVKLTEENFYRNLSASIDSVQRSPEDRNVLVITGLAADANFLSYTLEFKNLDDPVAEWELVTTGSSEVINGTLARWDIRDKPEGYYVLRLTVNDRAGNFWTYGGCPPEICEVPGGYGGFPEGEPEFEYIFYIEASTSTFASVSGPSDSYMFSPNDDGVLETAPIDYTIKGLSTISLWVTDSAGNVVWRKLLNETQGSCPDPANPGPGECIYSYSYSWDGSDGRGYADEIVPVGVTAPKVDDGDYVIHLLDSYVVGAEEEILFNVTVDTLDPAVAVANPASGSFIKGTESIIGSVTDINLSEFTVQFKALSDTLWQSLFTSHLGVDNNTLITWITDGLNGDYQLKIRAIDFGGNVTEVVTDYTVDNTSPYAWITDPVDGGAVNTAFNVTADTNNSDIAEIMFYIKADNEITWDSVGSSTSAPYTISLDSSNYNHGDYNLKGVAKDNAGNEDLYPNSITFLIDKNPPTSFVSAPYADSYVKGTISVTASSNDLDIGSIKIYYRTASVTTWTLLTDDNTLPYNISLDTTTLSDGFIYLQSVATDTGGLVELIPTETMIVIDNTLPSVSLTSPQQSEIIGGVYDIIGTAADINLDTYKVEYRVVGDTNFTEIINTTNSSITDGVLAVFDTTSLIRGDYEIRLTGTDKSGNSRFVESTIAVRNDVPNITYILLDKEVVSLNDPLETLTIDYALTEVAAAVDLDILENATGTVISQVATLPGTAFGANQYVYAIGTDLAGTVDGEYSVRITASDAFGSSSTNTAPFIIDNILPAISITEPLSGADVFDSLDIRGNITEANIASYEIFYGAGASPATWTSTGSHFTLPATDLLATIDVTTLEGNYTIKITALDDAGNISLDELIPVTIHDSSSPIENITLSNEFINTAPLIITFDLRREAGISIKVYDTNDTLIKTTTSVLTPEAVGNTIDYDLTDDTFALLNDGTYTINLDVYDPLTIQTTTHSAGMFTRDTVAPVVTITAPLEGATISDDTAITGTIDELNVGSYRLSYDPGDVELSAGTTPLASSVIGTLQTATLQGIVTVKLSVYDLANNLTEATVNVTVAQDSGGIISNVSLSPLSISPNTAGAQDGINDSTTLSFMQNVSGDLTIKVEEADTALPPVKTHSIGTTTGQQTFTWNGDDDLLAYVADGVYNMMVEIVATGTHLYNLGAVIVDNAAPSFTFSSPTDLSTVIDNVNIGIALTETNFASYSVNIKPIGDPTYPETPARASTNYSANMPLYIWNTRGLSGDYNILVTVNDLAGNTLSQEITVSVVDGNLPLISNVTLSESVISPGTLSSKNNTTIGFTIHREVQVTALIKDSSNNIVRTYATNETRSAGDYSFIFDGILDTTSQIGADGVYNLEIVVNDPFRSASVTETRDITIDATAPILSVTSPINLSSIKSTFDLTGSITEANLTDLSLSYNLGGLSTTIPVTVTGGTFSMTALESGIADGKLFLTLTAIDLGGNVTTDTRELNVDNTPPNVALSLIGASAVPQGAMRMSQATSLYPMLRGNILLSYSATDTNIQSLSISYASESDPATWTEVHSVTGSNVLNSIYDFDTENPIGTGVPLDDGVYLIKLSAIDHAGNSNETVVNVNVDNTLPVVSITSPVALENITGPYNIQGSVSDDNLFKYNVKLGAGVTPAYYDNIGFGTGSVTAGILHQWTPL